MTYVDFQKECAFNGFTATPLTEAEFDQALVAATGGLMLDQSMIWRVT